MYISQTSRIILYCWKNDFDLTDQYHLFLYRLNYSISESLKEFDSGKE